MEHQEDSAGTSGVSRGQNQLHVLPETWSAGAGVMVPMLDRIDPATAVPQLLVVTNDAESAAALSGKLAIAANPDLRILGATDARRATRVQRSSSAHVVVGAPEVLVELVRSTALKVDTVRAVVLAWVEDLDLAATRALETLVAELPKDSMRVVIADAVTPAVEQLVERYARRARRIQPAAAETLPVSLSYLATGESARVDAVRRVLDALDPESAVVIARSPDARARMEALLRSLGYSGDSATVQVADTPDAGARLVVLYELPASEDDLRRLVRSAGTARVIALVTARQLSALRRLAGGTVAPFVLPAAAERARTREVRVCDELREILATGKYSRELLSLEPLLADYDGVEVAAAALRLLEAERARPRALGDAAPPPMTRLYVNVGEMDSVRPADLVGAITNEGGISKSELGRVDVREKHSTVEVATSVANSVVSRLTGVSIKGRRALVKVDEGHERRPGPPRERSARPVRPGRDRPRRDR